MNDDDYKGLKASNEELEAFCYAISHDLRAPLRRAKGYCQAAIECIDDNSAETAATMVNRANQTLEEMTELVNDLLRLSRIQRQPLQRDEFNIGSMVCEICNQLQEFCNDKENRRSININIQMDQAVLADKGLTRIMLGNLLSNAWKYTKKTENAQIEFGVSLQQGKTVFFVRDNGIGYDMKYAYKLFTPFQRLHSAALFPGTGVGLATAQRIINRHGGRIWSESAVNKGATFYFTLD